MGSIRCRPALLALLSLIALLSRPISAQPSVSASPLLTWTHARQQAGGAAEQQTNVLYHQVENAQALLQDYLMQVLGQTATTPAAAAALSLLPPGVMEHPPHNIVLFVGSQLDASSLKGPLGERLNKIISSAHSSIVAPYAVQGSQEGSLLKQLEAQGFQLQAFGCQPQQQSAEDIVSSLQHALQSTQQHSTADAQTPQRVFAVCAPVAPATAASAQSELQLLESVQQALDQHASPSLVLYTTQRSSQSMDRRSTLSDGKAGGFGPYTVCGKLCQTQVKWIQGFISALFMCVALIAGMTCLLGVDGPTRFEKAREQ